MHLSNTGIQAIRSAYNRKIEAAADQLNTRNARILVFRIVETATISIADRKALIKSIGLSDQEVDALFDLMRDIYDDLFDSIREESEIG